MENHHDTIFTGAVIFAVHAIDFVARKLGKHGTEKLLCRWGIHDWKPVPGDLHLQYCSRCRVTDNIKTSGIDGMPKRKRRKLAKKLRDAIRGKNESTNKND